MTTDVSALEPSAEPSTNLGASRALWLQRFAALLAVLSVGEALGIVVLAARGDPRFRLDPSLITVGFLATVILFPVMGALIVQRRPFTKVAWLMVMVGLGVGFGLFAYAYGVVALPPSDPMPFAMPMLVLSQLFFVPSIGGATTWILLLYPTDHLLSPRWRWVGRVAVIALVLYVIGTLFRPSEIDPVTLPGMVNPIGLPGAAGAAFGALADASNIVGLGTLFAGVVSLILRYRRADRVVAAQIRWLALVALVAIVTLGASILPIGDLDDLLFGLGLTFAACMPIAIGIAITRYRLYDIDRLINRALVYGSLTAILAGVFTAGVGLAQRLFVAVTHETSDAAVVGATLVVATLYAPLRKRLEAIVDRRFKFEDARFGGYRDELTRLLTLTEPARAHERLAREARDELDALGAAVVDSKGSVFASAGLWPLEAEVRISLPGRGGAAALLVGPRVDGQPHQQRAIDALGDVATLAAEAIRRT